MRIFESLFDVAYIVIIFALGFSMLKNTKKGTPFRLFSYMALTLGCGDCFHLIPRLMDYWVMDSKFAMSVGGGVTAITMTFFYVMLYNFGCKYYNISDEEKEKGSILVWIMTVARMVIIMCPQNDWGGEGSPYLWHVGRNIPFCIMGIFIIIFFYKNSKRTNDTTFPKLWLAMTLSFAFYAPVFLLGDFVPGIGALMMPKTCAYIWITYMGYKAIKERAAK